MQRLQHGQVRQRMPKKPRWKMARILRKMAKRRRTSRTSTEQMAYLFSAWAAHRVIIRAADSAGQVAGGVVVGADQVPVLLRAAAISSQFVCKNQGKGHALRDPFCLR